MNLDEKKYTSVLFCPSKHELKKYHGRSFNCDICQTLIPTQYSYFCNQCNFDMCEKCFAEKCIIEDLTE